MSSIKNKEYIITLETGLWDKNKYRDRIKREKGREYVWPGKLPDDKKQYLPWRTNADEHIKRLKPGDTIKIKEVLYDAKKASRPGRFQCLEVEVDGVNKPGFVWTIYEGKTYITPKLQNSDGDKKHKFSVVNIGAEDDIEIMPKKYFKSKYNLFFQIEFPSENVEIKKIEIDEEILPNDEGYLFHKKNLYFTLPEINNDAITLKFEINIDGQNKKYVKKLTVENEYEKIMELIKIQTENCKKMGNAMIEIEQANGKDQKAIDSIKYGIEMCLRDQIRAVFNDIDTKINLPDNMTEKKLEKMNSGICEISIV